MTPNVRANDAPPVGALSVTTTSRTAQPGDTHRVVPPDAATEADRADPAAPGRSRAVVGVVGPLDVSGRRTIEVVVDGWRFEFEVEDAARAALRDRAARGRSASTGAGGPLEIRAIIPGRIAAVAVEPGASVEAGQTLLVVEAMKMQNELRAPRAGVVERIAVAAGQTVELGDLLVVVA
jgi:biotin carboxyl carrier protein